MTAPIKTFNSEIVNSDMLAKLRPLTKIAAMVITLLLLVTLLTIPHMQTPATAQPTSPSADEVDVVAQEQIRVEPAQASAAGTCSASVALVVDVGFPPATLDQTLDELRSELHALVDSLEGTYSQVGLYTFAYYAPAGENQDLPAVSMNDPDEVTDLRTRIDGLGPEVGWFQAGHPTNWHGGLNSVADDMAAGVDYSDVVLLTTRAANVDGTDFPTANQTWRQPYTKERRELDNALAAKQRLEELGADVTPIGVGPEVVSNNLVDIYARRTMFSPWQVQSQELVQDLIGAMATDQSEDLAVFSDYSGVASWIEESFITGCFNIVHEVADGDGEILHPGGGVEYQITPQGMAPLPVARTNSGGVADVGMPAVDDPVTVRVQEQPRDGFVPGDAPRCVDDSAGGAPIDVERLSGDNGISLQFDPDQNITCFFQSRPVIPIELTKNAVIAPDSLDGALTNQTYDFEFVCLDVDGAELANGELEGMVAGISRVVAEVPLGAECVVTELPTDVQESRMGMTTSWSATNAEGAADATNELQFTVSPNRNAYNAVAGTAVGAEVTALNSFTAATAPVEVAASIANPQDIPEMKLPSAISVQYSCRYIPDPNDLPEEGGNPNPIDLGQGTVTVPVGGSETIGEFPVGAQCQYAQISDEAGSPTIPGYSFNTAWRSNVCFSERPLDGGPATGDFVTCAANYTWVPNDNDDHRLEFVNTYEQQTATLNITKELAGEAAPAGENTAYLFDVVCRDAADASLIVFETQDPVSVTAGSATGVDEVPVDSECILTEREPEIDNVDVAIPEPTTVTLRAEDANTVVQAPVMTNTLEYQTGAITLTTAVDASGVVDDATAVVLRDAAFAVSAQCHVDDDLVFAGPVGTVAAGIPLAFPEALRFGTTCTFTLDSIDIAGSDVSLDGIDHVATFNPQPLILSEENATVHLGNVFTTSSGDLTLTNTVGASAPLLGADHLVPSVFDFSVACTDGTLAEHALTPGEQAVIPDIAAGAECTITETVVDPVELDRVTTWTVPGQSGQVPGETAGTSSTVTFTFPENRGATVSALNSYSPATSAVVLTQEQRLLDGDGALIDVDDPIYPAILGDYGDLPVNYVCTRADTVVSEGTQTVPTGQSRDVLLPVGADCTIAADARSIPSTSAGDTTYTGAGTETGRGVVVAVGPEDTHLDIEQNRHVLTGAFHLKKKVDGEGVTTIGNDRLYQLNWECRLNGVTVQDGAAAMGRFDNAVDNRVAGVPVGSECMVMEIADPQNLDPALGTETASEDYADWQARWDVTDGPTSWGENEQTCEAHANCTPGAEQNQVTFMVTAQSDADAPDAHFQGSLVVWNTYNYDRRPIEVTKDLVGDGPALADDEEFDFNLVCVDPRYTSDLSGIFDDGAELPATSFNEVVSVTGAGSASTVNNAPLGWDCVIREQQVDSYDAAVVTTFSGETVAELDQPADPTQPGGAQALFTTAPGEDRETGPDLPPLGITVHNDYERERAALFLSATYGDSATNNVHPYLNDYTEFQVEWSCTDPYSSGLGGMTAVPADGAEVELLDGEAQLPVSVECDFTELVDDKIPAGYEDVIQSHHAVSVTRGEEELLPRTFSHSVSGVRLAAEEPTRVAFENSYWVETFPLGFTNIVESDPNHEVIAQDTPFIYEYTCRVENLLPGQNLDNFGQLTGGAASGTHPTVVNGTATLTPGEEWAHNLPVGSSCEVRNPEVPAVTTSLLADRGLDMQPNYEYLAERDSTPENGQVGGRYPLADSRVIALDETRAVALVYHSIFHAGGEPVAVQTVNPDGTPVPGGVYAIHRASPGPDSPMEEDPVATGLGGDLVEPVIAQLPPGSYYLVTEDPAAGAVAMFQPWRFDVVPVDPTEAGNELGDVRMQLGTYTGQTGMLEIAPPAPEEEDDPWIIQVANVAAGTLPLTGGSGVWKILGGGGALLLLALGWFGLRKRLS